MNMLRLACSIIALPLGIIIFIYGGSDDSPGAQLLGFMVFLAGILGIAKSRKKNLPKG